MKKPLSDGVRKLVIDYFNCDVLDLSHGLSAGIKENIIATFTFAYNNHLTKRQITEELKDSNLSELRDRLRSNNKPFPVRWGELKPKLQAEAVANNISMHLLCRNIVQLYYKGKEAIG